MKFFDLNKKIIFSIIFSILLFGIFSLPVKAVTSGYNYNESSFQIVPSCIDTETTSSGGTNTYCGWKSLLQLVRNIMTFMLYFSASIAVISFAYAGFLYMTAFGEMGKVEQAHGIFSKVMVGFLFVFLAWLIVATILKTLGVVDSFSLINFNTVTKFSN